MFKNKRTLLSDSFSIQSGMEEHHAFYLSIFDACEDNDNIILLCFGDIFYIHVIHMMFVSFQHGPETASGTMLVQEWHTLRHKLLSSFGQ
jgi:hypothetical protein